MFSKILLPIDLTETDLTQRSVETATKLAKAFDAEVRIINTQTLVPMAYIDYMPEDFSPEIKLGLEKEIADIAARIDLPQERISTRLLFGPVYQKTLGEAEEWGADVIVVGSHQPGMERMLISSDAVAIVNHAHCSVLVVRGYATPPASAEHVPQHDV